MSEDSTNEQAEDPVRALLAVWRELEPYAGNGGQEFRGSNDQRVIQRWRDLFGPEIVYVRKARDLVAHSPDSLAESELREAVKAARKLRDLLFSGLKYPAAVLPELLAGR